jgi:hypothetical protein
VPDDDESLRQSRLLTAAIGIAAGGLERFALYIIRHIRAGGALDDEAFDRITADSIRDAKNAELPGVPIEREAQTIGQGVKALEYFIKSAISKGKADHG